MHLINILYRKIWSAQTADAINWEFKKMHNQAIHVIYIAWQSIAYANMAVQKLPHIMSTRTLGHISIESWLWKHNPLESGLDDFLPCGDSSRKSKAVLADRLMTKSACVLLLATSWSRHNNFHNGCIATGLRPNLICTMQGQSPCKRRTHVTRDTPSSKTCMAPEK